MRWIALAGIGCTAPGVPVLPGVLPEPDAWTARGPGASARSFQEAELFVPCAFLGGDERDAGHHNLSVIHDGWLVHPWAPEFGGGGVSFWDASDPCAPVLHGEVYAPSMRESHSLAFGQVGDREFLAVDSLEPGSRTEGGVGFFDITDPSDPFWVGSVNTPGFTYPDSYLRVTFATFWLGDVLYVAAAGNGVIPVDVTDPEDPRVLEPVRFIPPHVVGSVVVVGDLAIVGSAGTSRLVLLDVSDPRAPAPIPGGDVDLAVDGRLTNYYFSSVAGRYGLFARKDRGGGPIVVDLTDPGAPAVVGHTHTPDGDGGYVYRNGERLFQGDSTFGAVWDIADPGAPVEIARVDVRGDLDTISPLGNVMVVSVDSGAAAGEASVVFPWAAEPDARAPVAEWFRPADGATTRATTAIGVSFDEWIEARSVHAGSFRVFDGAGRPIPGRFHVQEAVANFVPDAPLPRGLVQVVVPPGGVADISGNPIEQGIRWSFQVR